MAIQPLYPYIYVICEGKLPIYILNNHVSSHSSKIFFILVDDISCFCWIFLMKYLFSYQSFVPWSKLNSQSLPNSFDTIMNMSQFTRIISPRQGQYIDSHAMYHHNKTQFPRGSINVSSMLLELCSFNLKFLLDLLRMCANYYFSNQQNTNTTTRW